MQLVLDRPYYRGYRVAAFTVILTLAAAALTVGTVVALSASLTDRASAVTRSVPPTRPAPLPAFTPIRDPLSDVPEPPPLLPLRLSVRATNVSWVTACADGKKVFERLFQNGDEVEIPFSQTALLRSGNAGGLEVTLAGQSFRQMGPWGVTRMLEASPQGYQFVTPILTDPCTAR